MSFGNISFVEKTNNGGLLCSQGLMDGCKCEEVRQGRWRGWEGGGCRWGLHSKNRSMWYNVYVVR